jgi:hypothetical protein
MNAFPNDVWRIISKYLRPRELCNCHHAKDVASPPDIAYMKSWGPILKEFDQIFKDYDWVESVESCGSILIFVYRDKQKWYLDLYLGMKEVPWNNMVMDDVGRT